MAKSANKKRKSVLLRVFVLIFAVYMFYNLVSLQMEYVSKKEVLSSKTEELEQKQIKSAEMDSLLKNGDEVSFIERQAREKLGFVYENEVVFTDISGN